MNVFLHHIYEFKKGLRSLILHTERASMQEMIEKKLSSQQIAYKIYHIGNGRLNVFFGDPVCVNIVKNIGKSLSDYTDEEDFILGIMLGYDRKKQCVRYINRKQQKQGEWYDLLAG